MSRKKILLMAHDVTLAHVGRPLKLGELLHADGHDVVLATSADSARFLAGFPGRTRTLAPTGKARFIDNLAKGRPVFDYATLKRYAEEDEAVLSAEKPDLVIGDFRITLSITARRLSIPYATLTNAYWSPAFTPRFIVPDLPMVRFLGVRLSQAIFDAVRPLAFALHCRPMDALRRHYGLPPLGPDLRRIYTDADLALFSDIPEVYGLYGDIPGGHFLGPVRWSPEVPLPDWWAALDPNKPLIYVTLGSSGDGRLLPRLLDRLARPGLQLAVATAGATVGVTAPDVFCADYLPGDAVAARAALVICNGGSPTCAQALAAGVPVLGVPGNLDQYLNMHYLEGQGVGLTLRNRELDGPNLKRTVDRLLGEPSFRRAAQSLAATLSRYDLAERLREALRRLTA
ncbi:MAG TPA: glycosyltransferase [Rhodocyclaceae bacterium]|nr:glycosyltransferase [Rhodocyclaceae bacterium]HNC80579.1 glycosyltransferase [Rhodocyclaceae bacterium]HNF61973.1 glycosyltransferase [Rhodocyclaceae bacterium]